MSCLESRMLMHPLYSTYESDNMVAYSARSMGKLNVQIIMEKLGGGGHLTMAGAPDKGN